MPGKRFSKHMAPRFRFSFPLRPSRPSPRPAFAAFASAFAVAVALLLSGCGRGDAPHIRGALLVTGGADINGPSPPPGAFLPVSSDLLPNAATALSGLLPPAHGIRVNGVGALPSGTATLPMVCAAAGWDCAAFLSDPVLSRSHGLASGFEVFSAAATTNRAAGFGRSASEICAAAATWLDGRKDRSRPVLLWLHFPRLPDPTTPGDALAPLLAAFRGEGAKIAFAVLGPEPGKEVLPSAVPAWAAAADGAGPTLACLAAALAPDGANLPADARPHWESVAPWYAMRLPPLGTEAAAEGLRDDPAATPLGHQFEMTILAARGHLGEGLVPPLPEGMAPVAALDDDALARIRRWREISALPPGTNRVTALRALSGDFPDVPLFQEALGDALAHDKDWTGACNAYAAAAKCGWNMVRANRMQARCHAMLGNVPAAIDRAEAAFLADQTDPVPRRELSDLLLRTGAALLAAGDLKEARGCLDRSLLLAPDHPGAAFERARLDLATGATNSAAAGLRDLLRRHPSDVRARKLLESLPAH